MKYKKDIINSQKDLKIILQNNQELITKAKYGPSKQTKIPLDLNKELAFFVGAIIGDGHIRKDKFQISIEGANKKLLKYIQAICRNIFNREFNIHPVKIKEGRKPTFSLLMDSKSIYNLLKDVFEIPSGKKSHIVKAPKHIIESNKQIKKAFLNGIMSTEGGKRKRGYGMSTASKQLWNDLVKLFNDVKIKTLVDKWTHKKYKREYYGLSFKKEYLSIIAGVPERSNGVGLGPTGLVPS